MSTTTIPTTQTAAPTGPTTTEMIRGFAKAIKAETDFYLDGRRYSGNVILTKGTLMAQEICGELDAARFDVAPLLAAGRRPFNHRGEIYPEYPDRKQLAWLNASRAQRRLAEHAT